MKRLFLITIAAALPSLTGISAGAAESADAAGTEQPAKAQKAYQEGTWTEDYAEAVNAAVKLKRPIFVDFTGSDWCGWCIR